ncbi:hypothetical protein HPB47_021446 [Ixodes persulcatus]|uniref:Uncharacterized protein n=1 Tax=Ixodes persulcatus TaxID=34615 RepID=A0AC60QCU7_IXOPE|nr:hypothetical protein HPB47_021446 [Ixodes persulcatus]
MYDATLQDKDRMNNTCEGWSTGFQKLVGHAYPSVLRLIECLQQNQALVATALTQPRRNEPTVKRSILKVNLDGRGLSTLNWFPNLFALRTASKKLRVRLGEHDTSTTSESPHGHVDLVPDRVIAHEGYDASLVKNDIALVVLRGRAPLGKGIGTACLPSEDGGASRLNGKAALVAGWGATSSGGNMSRVLRETTVPILAHEDCAKSYQGLLDIDENHLCAGTSAGDRDACKGDSGGPLMLPDNDQRFSVIGVTSFGVHCGDSDFPGVYTRVSRYLKWITSKLDTLGAS